MISKKLIPYQQALDILLSIAEKQPLISTECIQVDETSNRILAEDILSPINVPTFNNSAMDGFAIQSKIVNTALKHNDSIKLEVTGSIQAGDASDLSVDASIHQVWEIMTGAPVPNAFDAIIPIENVEIVENLGHKYIVISENIMSGKHIRKLGTDYHINQQVVNKHALVQPQHVLALATVGLTEVKVIPKLKVAILSTGNELSKKPANSLKSGKIFNSNQPYLKTYCQHLNCDPVFVGLCKDNTKNFDLLIDQAQQNDVKIIFSTGAVSMGKYDFIPQTLLNRGAKIHFHKSKIRPGKPILFAELPEGTYYFGLPGNPIAAAAGMRFFVSPFIRTLLNLAPEKFLKAKLLNTIDKKQGFRTFAKAIANIDETGQLCVEMLFDQGSYQSRSFAQSNCWLILPENRKSIQKGESIDIAPMVPNLMVL
jgi:molybdopterin molybdotransferase